MTLADADFRLLQEMMQSQAAITLNPDQTSFIEARLSDFVFRQGLGTVTDWLSRLRHSPSPDVVRRTVEALTIHETSFFRDLHPFEALKGTVIPALMAARAQERRLNIWSAACASGQEPYSLAMLLAEHFPALATWDVRIIATDISQAILQKAASGRYSQFEVNRGLPAAYLIKYMQQEGTDWVIRPVIRDRVTFLPLNLKESWPMLPTLDLVLLRNVLIYFQPAQKHEIVERLRRNLRSDGYLFLGSSESLLSLGAAYTMQAIGSSICYQPSPP